MIELKKGQKESENLQLVHAKILKDLHGTSRRWENGVRRWENGVHQLSYVKVEQEWLIRRLEYIPA